MSQTDLTQPATADGRPGNTGTTGHGWRRQFWSGPAIALLILPAIMLVTGLLMIGYMSPIYSGLHGLDYDPAYRYRLGLDYDPAYQYLFNGVALMKGFGPAHMDHPGTPVQLLIGLISICSWSIATLSGLTSLPFPQSVAADPEPYLRVVMTAFLIMNCVAVYFAGLAIARSTRFMMAGLACQSGYFLLGALFPRIFHAAPEAMLFLAATALMAVLAPAIFGDEECSDRRAVSPGFSSALASPARSPSFRSSCSPWCCGGRGRS